MRISKLTIPAVVVGLTLILTGCAGGGGGGSTGGGGGETDPAVIEESTALVDELSQVPAAPELLPAFTPSADPITVGILNCGQEAVSCQRMEKGAQDAAAVLGWETVVADGKLNPVGWNAGMAYLIQEDVDIIIKFAEADNAIPAAMADAAAAGIPVVCAVCANSEADPVGDGSVANADVDWAGQAEALGAYAISQTDGAASLIGFKVDGVPPLLARIGQLEETVGTCAGCSLNVQNVVQEPGWDTKIRNQLIAELGKSSEGDVDYIVPPSDTNSRAVAEAIEATGRDEIKILSYDCDDSGLDMISNGGPEVMCVDTPLTWLGWAAADLAARVIAGEDVQGEQVNIPIMIIDESTIDDHDTFDYASLYTELWGK
jgi:ribose transport system substrate-binding protein